jgi:hypothetical protein
MAPSAGVALPRPTVDGRWTAAGRALDRYRQLMTTPGDSTDPEALEAELLAALVAARTDLERVRTVLVDRDRGVTGSRAVQEVVASHWREHGAAHRTVWRLVGEEVRGALLVQLHDWKRQLREQLDAQGSDEQARTAPAADATTAADASEAADESEAALEHLRDRLADAEPGLDRTELMIELAELHATRDDHPEAEALFLSAERELEPYRNRATRSGIAEALVTSLPAMMRGDAADARAEIEPLVRGSRLLQRVYEGLVQVATDADAVRGYVERQRELEASLARDRQDDLELKRRLVDELSRQLGASAPVSEDPETPER